MNSNNNNNITFKTKAEGGRWSLSKYLLPIDCAISYTKTKIMPLQKNYNILCYCKLSLYIRHESNFFSLNDKSFYHMTIMLFSEIAHVINNVMTTRVLTPAQLPIGYQ